MKEPDDQHDWIQRERVVGVLRDGEPLYIWECSKCGRWDRSICAPNNRILLVDNYGRLVTCMELQISDVHNV